jgi:hypothetical protein
MNAATRAVIERLVEALVAMQTEARARNCGLKICADAIAEARKLLEGDALAQPADEDAWQREMFSLINELHSAGLDGSRGRCRDAVLALNENVRTRPQQAGFVSVPVEPTPKMIDSTFDDDLNHRGESHNQRNRRIYKAMIAAATKGAGK